MKVSITKGREISKWLIRLSGVSFCLLILLLIIPSLVYSSKLVDVSIAMMIVSLLLGIITRGPNKIGEMAFLSRGLTLQYGNGPMQTFHLHEMVDIKLNLYYYRGKQIGFFKIIPDDGVMNEIQFTSFAGVNFKFNFTLENKGQLLKVKSLIQEWLQINPEIALADYLQID